MTPADLKSWRNARGLTLDQAAELLGVARSWYAYAEAGTDTRGRKRETIPARIELAVLKIDMRGNQP